MSKASRRNDQYEGEKEGYSVWKKRVERDKKSGEAVADRELYYKKGFLPGTIEGLDIHGDEYLDYISLRDYLQIIHAGFERSKLLKNSVTRQSFELEDKKCDYTLRLYVRKEVGQLPTVLDAFLFDMKNGVYAERLNMDGDLTPKAGFGREDVVAAYHRIAQELHEDEAVSFTAFEYVKIEDRMILNQMFVLPPYPAGPGFSEGTNEYLLDMRRKQIWTYKRYRKSKFSRKFHRLFFNAKRLGLVSKGFTAKRAEIWLLKAAVDKEMMKDQPASERRFAKEHGFTLNTVKKLGINEKNCEDFISEKEYYRLVPINLKYQKWIATLPTIYYVFKPFREYMAEFYYHVMMRDGEALIIPYGNQTESEDYFTQIKNLLMEKGSITAVDVNGKRIVDFHYKDEKFFAGNREVEYVYIWKYITRTKEELVLIETVDNAYSRNPEEAGRKASELYLYVYNRNGQGAAIGGARVKIYNNIGHYTAYSINMEDGSYTTAEGTKVYLKQWEEINSLISKMGRHVPQLEFFAIEMLLREDSIQIRNMVNHPEYRTDYPFSKELMDFFKEKAAEKNEFYDSTENATERGKDTGKRRFKQRFASLFYPKGLVPYISVTWPRDVRQDFFSNKDCSFSKKMWAYKHGFLSYRLDQYGITEENWEEYISDFEYKWLRHINPYYKTWLEDKITVKYIANRYNQYFPEYYYHVICKNGEMNIIPLMDCPMGYGPELASIINLVKEKKVMAFKPDEGSHGNGFFRCDYKDGEFYINYEKATEQDVIDRLSQNDTAYIITEYIQMHPQLKEIYSGSVNTIRMIVFKKDGVHPEIGNAYMRIGTSKTGAIDNMAAGGMFAAIDIETGRYGGAKIFVDGDIKDCERHPDTDVLIEGTMPNWELTKKLVLDIASEIRELEYFGFDLAVTEDGIKIPEINRSPDYPKIEKYNRATIDYLLYKLDRKKKVFGYDKKPNHTLVHLPYREKKIEK